jgi:hypothetical protein
MNMPPPQPLRPPRVFRRHVVLHLALTLLTVGLCSAPQNPSAPSPTASTGADIPRRTQSRSRSAHDSTDSR